MTAGFKLNSMISRGILIASAIVCTTLSAVASAPPGGPEQFSSTSTHAQMNCTSMPSCPGSRNQNGVFGSDCGYCAIQRNQSHCEGAAEGTCTQHEYRQGASTCGVRYVGGTINPNGDCVGAVANGVCYRTVCTYAVPGVL